MTAKVSKAYRQDSFQKALKEASARLTEAQDERVEALASLTALDAEIPALTQTIAALQQQLNPQALVDSRMPPVTWTAAHYNSKTGAMTPASPVIDVVTNADDLLPELDGTPIIPED